MAQPIPEHKDKLGVTLKEGDCVATASSNSLIIAKVVRLTPKMVRIKQIKLFTERYSWETNKYPSDVIKLDGPDVTMYLLKNE
jgi:hypothetical protein